MQDSNMVPVTILTGFLGSGKTTLLNRILKEDHGHRIAVIENEFGETGVDSEIIEKSEEQIVEMNNGCICCTVRGDLIRILGTLKEKRDGGKLKFDLIILDPPKFAPTAAQVKKAARAYKDINLWALKLLAPGGLLATFSCSGGVNAELFQSVVAGAALDAGANAKIIERFGAAADHPVALEFPEGEYLKGLLLLKS